MRSHAKRFTRVNHGYVRAGWAGRSADSVEQVAFIETANSAIALGANSSLRALTRERVS
jgi:hypothetical protein